MNPLIVHEDAERELWEAVDYYETKSTGLGLDLEKEIRQAFKHILISPRQFQRRKYNTRCYLLKRFPYSIYFLEFENIIWIVAIAHMKRKPFYWHNRLKE